MLGAGTSGGGHVGSASCDLRRRRAGGHGRPPPTPGGAGRSLRERLGAGAAGGDGRGGPRSRAEGAGRSLRDRRGGGGGGGAEAEDAAGAGGGAGGRLGGRPLAAAAAAVGGDGAAAGGGGQRPSAELRQRSPEPGGAGGSPEPGAGDRSRRRALPAPGPPRSARRGRHHRHRHGLSPPARHPRAALTGTAFTIPTAAVTSGGADTCGEHRCTSSASPAPQLPPRGHRRRDHECGILPRVELWWHRAVFAALHTAPEDRLPTVASSPT